MTSQRQGAGECAVSCVPEYGTGLGTVCGLWGVCVVSRGVSPCAVLVMHIGLWDVLASPPVGCMLGMWGDATTLGVAVILCTPCHDVCAILCTVLPQWVAAWYQTGVCA